MKDIIDRIQDSRVASWALLLAYILIIVPLHLFASAYGYGRAALGWIVEGLEKYRVTLTGVAFVGASIGVAVAVLGFVGEAMTMQIDPEDTDVLCAGMWGCGGPSVDPLGAGVMLVVTVLMLSFLIRANEDRH